MIYTTIEQKFCGKKGKNNLFKVNLKSAGSKINF